MSDLNTNDEEFMYYDEDTCDIAEMPKEWLELHNYYKPITGVGYVMAKAEYEYQERQLKLLKAKQNQNKIINKLD